MDEQTETFEHPAALADRIAGSLDLMGLVLRNGRPVHAEFVGHLSGEFFALLDRLADLGVEQRSPALLVGDLRRAMAIERGGRR
jgi:hypothetical protein